MVPAKKWPSPVRLFFVLVLFQILHSVEEIAARLYIWFPRVTGKIKETCSFFPQLSLSRDTFIIVNIIFIMMLFVIGVFVSGQRGWAWRVALVIGVIEVLNGSAHIAGAIAVGGYFPGSASAVGLVIAGAIFLRSYLRHPRDIA